jgi:hypothetical protein
VTYTHRRRLAACAVVAVIGAAGATAFATSANAAPGSKPTQATQNTLTTGAALTNLRGPSWIDQVTRAKEVQFAETHWNWTAWNDPTPVAFGADQNNYQCAEFVARAMAAAGLVPGLSPNSPQNDYFKYTAPNGKVYDLLLITPLPQYNTIYQYMMDAGIATDVGDQPTLARPGDFVVTYAGANGVASHMGLIATAPVPGGAEATVDAHNHARLHYGYHFYAPSHLVELAPDALYKIQAWVTRSTPKAPARTAPITPNHRPGAVPFADPAGPQV